MAATTENTLLNWYTYQWDMFLESFEEKLDALNQISENWFFRNTSTLCYTLYRNTAQIMDLMLLDATTLSISPQKKALTCLLIGLVCNVQDIVLEEFWIESKFAIECAEKNKEALETLFAVFGEFCEQSANLKIEELGRALRSAVRFVCFEFSDILPVALQNTEEEEVYM